MDEQTKKIIYKILEQAKVLEELMREVELPLSKGEAYRSISHTSLIYSLAKC